MLFAAPVLAQPDAGTVGTSVIIGTVIDSSTKKPVADVVVTATSPAMQGEQTVVTDTQGNYRIPQLPPGVYTLRFEKESFKPYARPEIQLLRNRTIRVNVELLPDSFSHSVEVIGAPPTIDVGSTNMGVNIDEEFIKRIAVARPAGKGGARSYESLAELSRGTGGYVVDGRSTSESVSTTASGTSDRQRAPAWALPYMHIVVPDAPFSVSVEGFPSPARKGYQVVHIGVKAREVSRAQRKPSHLVFVIDVSGSMDMENRLGLVKQSLRLLVDALDERDRVSIVVYGSEARQVLAPTNATRKQELLAAIDSLHSEGSTNAQAGIEMGYALAASQLVEGGINRIILCSDGVANNGITQADGIWDRVKAQAATGITLSTVGFGMGNYNDVLMERLSQVGEGNYAYVDKLDEARRIFVQNLTGTLQVVAKDVKIQVEFDRKTVSRYRLIGYENRLLTKQQFADDTVDAGEVGAGHAVTALYEVKLRAPSQTSFGTLRIRYKAPQGGKSQLIEKAMPSVLLRPAYEQAAAPTRLSYVAAAFAEKLRGSYWARPLTYDALVSLWEELGAPMKARPDVVELGTLIRSARTLDRRADRFESFAPVRTMDADRVPTIK
nr:YfbK domain-containing protein [Corallococcus llansteffanensis]